MGASNSSPVKLLLSTTVISRTDLGAESKDYSVVRIKHILYKSLTVQLQTSGYCMIYSEPTSV